MTSIGDPETHAPLPADVQRRLERDFAGETFFEALRLVETLELPPRVLRSVLVLAAGDYPELERFARSAELDPRDVIFWAEYVDHDAAEPRRVRDLSEPLPD